MRSKPFNLKCFKTQIDIINLIVFGKMMKEEIVLSMYQIGQNQITEKISFKDTDKTSKFTGDLSDFVTCKCFNISA